MHCSTSDQIRGVDSIITDSGTEPTQASVAERPVALPPVTERERPMTDIERYRGGDDNCAKMASEAASHEAQTKRRAPASRPTSALCWSCPSENPHTSQDSLRLWRACYPIAVRRPYDVGLRSLR